VVLADSSSPFLTLFFALERMTSFGFCPYPLVLLLFSDAGSALFPVDAPPSRCKISQAPHAPTVNEERLPFRCHFKHERLKGLPLVSFERGFSNFFPGFPVRGAVVDLSVSFS